MINVSSKKYIEGTLMIKNDLSGFEPYFKDKWRDELFKNIKIFIKDKKLYMKHL